MPESMNGAPGNGTSAEGAPVDNGQGFDFERSYNELRPEYTRTTQDLAATRDRLSAFESLFEALHDTDPEVQQEAMEALGLEPVVETGSPSGAQEEFVDPLEREVEELRAWRDQVDRERELEAAHSEDAELSELRDSYIGEEIGLIESMTSEAFTDAEEEVLGNLAIAMEDDEGIPDVRAAYERMFGSEGVLESRRQRWIETKTGAAMPPLGTSIPAEQRPQTPAARVDYIDERWRALQDQQ